MDFSTGSEVPTRRRFATAVSSSKTVHAPRFEVKTDTARDELLTDFGKDTLSDRYLLPGESYQDLFARVAVGLCRRRRPRAALYDYISKLWFMPATPVLSNGGTGRGLPICCYLNSVDDSLEASSTPGTRMSGWPRSGGGIGTYWGHVRGIGEPVGLNGKTSGIIPFVRVMDSLTLAISQGSLRRGSAACYLDISHPEIEEFLEIRKPSGDFNRKALNLHHGVLVTDAFMEAVRDGAEFVLRSPKDGSERGKVDARSLFQKLVETRLATGEPYIIFIDQVNRSMPKHHRDLGLKVTTSNLCSEITLPTGTRPSRRRPHRGVLPVVAQPRDLGRVERRQALHRGRHALPRQCAQRLYRPRAGRDGARQISAPSASARSASA